jgi:glutaredoxin
VSDIYKKDESSVFLYTTVSIVPTVLRVYNMVIKLYGQRTSPFVHIVLVVLKETNTPYELHEISTSSGETKRESYLEKQPFGQIPYMVCLSI